MLVVQNVQSGKGEGGCRLCLIQRTALVMRLVAAAALVVRCVMMDLMIVFVIVVVVAVVVAEVVVVVVDVVFEAHPVVFVGVVVVEEALGVS